MKRLWIFFVMAQSVVALADTFVSSPFRLDMRMENGVRVAEATEIIHANVEWAEGDVAVVTHTPPGGVAETVHTTTSGGAESFVWDALHSVAGNHLFTHTTRRNGVVVDSLSVTFTVPEPTLNAVRIFGKDEVNSGNTVQYVCMGYYSDDSGREVTPSWSIVESVTGISIDEKGLLTTAQLTSDQTITVRATVEVDEDTVLTNDLKVTIAAAYLTVKPMAVSVEKTGGEQTVTVLCSGSWSAKTATDWLKLTETAGDGDALFGFTALRNTETSTRKGTITFTCGKLSATLAVKQAAGDEVVHVTVAFDAQGGFVNYTSHDYIVGETYGTLPFATKTGKVFGGWWTLPGGQGVQVVAMSEVIASATKLYAHWRDATTADALDGALDWTDDGDAAWVIDTTTCKNGNSSMRSGAIGNNESATLMTEVTGPGTLSFWWRTSCEELYDKLMFFDGVSEDSEDAVMELSGETGWEHQTYTISDSGTHLLRWVFAKDDSDGVGRDCAWLDGVIWMPTFAPGEMTGESTGDQILPKAWKTYYGIESTSSDADSDGDGMTDWEEYIVGSNPIDPGSTFKLDISIEEGEPVLQPMPYLGGQRNYIIEGKENLTDIEWVTPVKSTHRFFRAKVEIK